MHYVVLLIACVLVIAAAVAVTQYWLSELERKHYRWNIDTQRKNHAQAAALISRTHNKVIKILDFMRSKYNIDNYDNRDNPAPYEQLEIVNAILDNYNPDEIYENQPGNLSETSYTIGKGSKLYLCVRDRVDPNRLVSDDVLLFVVLHELSHIGDIRTVGHQQRFWEVFKFVLRQAKESGHYTPVDYSKEPVMYCGIKVKYNPYFDGTIRDI